MTSFRIQIIHIIQIYRGTTSYFFCWLCYSFHSYVFISLSIAKIAEISRPFLKTQFQSCFCTPKNLWLHCKSRYTKWMIITGLYPGDHNIIANQFADVGASDGGKMYFDRANEHYTGLHKWWNANEPIWASASKAGLNFSTFLWSRYHHLPWHTIPKVWFLPNLTFLFFFKDVTLNGSMWRQKSPSFAKTFTKRMNPRHCKSILKWPKFISRKKWRMLQ